MLVHTSIYSIFNLNSVFKFTMLFLVLVLVNPATGYHCPQEDHCTTSLDIDYGFTMVSSDRNKPVYAKGGQLYDITSSEQVSIENVISADGWNETKHLITANGSMPGPDIIVYQNQTITIIIRNKLINEAVTIHWHGIDQLGSPAMDGTAFITQCPIMPGQEFRYTFTPRFGGSYWYHSHVGNQRDNGLYGAFIVLRKDDPVPFSHQNIILIQEYNHLHSAETILKGPVSEKNHAVLINGRGSYKDIEAPVETFHLHRGNKGSSTYLFRIISAAGEETLLLEIPGLKLKITETDGWQVDPVQVDKIIINPAERYDFEIDLDCAEHPAYNITIRILNTNTLNVTHDVIGLASINVTGLILPPPAYCGTSKRSKILNCPFEIYPYRPNLQCIPVSGLKSRIDSAEKTMFRVTGISKTDVTVKDLHFLNFAFVDGPTINGRKFIWPTVSALNQPTEVSTDCKNCTEERPCRCSHSIDLKSGSEVIMVLLNLGKNSKSHHPIHLHGHTFQILKMEFAEFSTERGFIPTTHIKCSKTLLNNESSCNAAFWADPSWNNYRNIPGIHLENPVRKDTVIVPFGGYVIIRIEATNPGVWFMHCHLDKHMVDGMAVMLNESFSSYHGREGKLIPLGLPTCRSFLQNMNGHVEKLPETLIDIWTSTVIVLSAFLVFSCVLCFILIVALWSFCLSNNRNKNINERISRYKSTDDVQTRLIPS